MREDALLQIEDTWHAEKEHNEDFAVTNIGIVFDAVVEGRFVRLLQ